MQSSDCENYGTELDSAKLAARLRLREIATGCMTMTMRNVYHVWSVMFNVRIWMRIRIRILASCMRECELVWFIDFSNLHLHIYVYIALLLAVLGCAMQSWAKTIIIYFSWFRIWNFNIFYIIYFYNFSFMFILFKISSLIF